MDFLALTPAGAAQPFANIDVGGKTYVADSNGVISGVTPNHSQSLLVCGPFRSRQPAGKIRGTSSSSRKSNRQRSPLFLRGPRRSSICERRFRAARKRRRFFTVPPTSL
jgi:hypothetical protein